MKRKQQEEIGNLHGSFYGVTESHKSTFADSLREFDEL